LTAPPDADLIGQHRTMACNFAQRRRQREPATEAAAGGNRSNASALGVRVDWRPATGGPSARCNQFPLEIGVGKHDKLDALKTRWFDLSSTLVDVAVPTNQMTLDELTLPSGSCPYLYAWDGQKFNL